MSLSLFRQEEYQRTTRALLDATGDAGAVALMQAVWAANVRAFREQYPHCEEGQQAPLSFGFDPQGEAESVQDAAEQVSRYLYNTNPRGRRGSLSRETEETLHALVARALERPRRPRRPRPASVAAPAPPPMPSLF